jgi:hypothetical protein
MCAMIIYPENGRYLHKVAAKLKFSGFELRVENRKAKFFLSLTERPTPPSSPPYQKVVLSFLALKRCRIYSEIQIFYGTQKKRMNAD